MKDSNIPKPPHDPVKEARRYVENAQTLLREHGDLDTETQLYRDSKYVRMAGNTLWNGVLLILDAVFHVSEKAKDRPSIRNYQEAVAGRDYKLLDYVTTGYTVMHLSMGYDGSPSKANCQDGLRIANAIIDRCERMLAIGR